MTGGNQGFGGSQGGEEQAGGQARGQRRGNWSGGQGGQGGGRMAGMTPEQQKKFREAMQKAANGKNPQDMTDEERQQYRAKMQQVMAETESPAARAGQAAAAPGAGRRRARRLSASLRVDRAVRDGRLAAPNGSVRSSWRTPNCLLRPKRIRSSMCCSGPAFWPTCEIIVEKVPNAVHVPNQAVFESEGKPVVYVKTGNTFEPRRNPRPEAKRIGDDHRLGREAGRSDRTRRSDGRQEREGHKGKEGWSDERAAGRR